MYSGGILRWWRSNCFKHSGKAVLKGSTGSKLNVCKHRQL